jgi:hypothetical protein
VLLLGIASSAPAGAVLEGSVFATGGGNGNMAANASDNAAAASPFEEHGPGATLKTPPARGAAIAKNKSAVPPRFCSASSRDRIW